MESRVLILAPHGRDAQVIGAVLQSAGLHFETCADAACLQAELQSPAGTAVITEEVLTSRLSEWLREYLSQQPAWSDFPFVVLANRETGRRSPQAAAALRGLGNVVLLERPVNPETLVSAVRSALRGRARQYASRHHLMDIESAKQTVEQLNAALESRIATRTSDLANANDRLMREIADKERIQSAVVQGQKLEAIGRLTGGIAHDFNNLLHAVNLNLQLIMRLGTDPRASEFARRAKGSADRGARLTAQLLSFARTQSLLPRRLDVNALVRNLQELIEVSVGSKIQVALELEAQRPWVLLDGAQLEMALLNMAVNARDAMPEGGTLTIRTRLAGADDSTAAVQISMQDTGCGIPAAIQAKVFDPFFTTKADGEGTGLGLSQVYGFARQSGGSVEIDSAEGEGTTIVLNFAQAAEGAPDDAQAAAPPTQGLAREQRVEVLVVEDDDAVRQGICDGLRLLQYSVREASDGEGGLRELRRRRPDLVMADYLMPGMNGAQFIAAARETHPDIPVLVATGYADMAEVERLVDAQSILKKPFDLETLNAAVRRELARAAAQA